jgi:hypothetical protein
MPYSHIRPATVELRSPAIPERIPTALANVDSVEASACCGGCAGTGTPLVYAIGEVDYDFPSLSRLNSLQQSMATLFSTGRQLSAQNRLDFARHLCGFQERKLNVASGLLSWNSAAPTATVGGDTGLKLQIESGDDLIADDDYRRILIDGVLQRKPSPSGGFSPWQPWRLNRVALPIGRINKTNFILRTVNIPPSHVDRYNFDNATFVLPRGWGDEDSRSRIHPPHEYDAQAVIWKLRRGSTNIYAIKPGGNYSEAAYGELIDFLLEGQGVERNALDIYYFDTPHGRQAWAANWDPGFNARDCCLANAGTGTHSCCTNYQRHDKKDYPPQQGRLLERTQRVSIPGLTGGTAKLLNGDTLTEIAPDMRGTHSWSLARLHSAIEEAIQTSGSSALLDTIMAGIDNILKHLDERVRNRGVSSQDRALNYAATRMVDILPSVASSLVATSSTFELDDVSPPTRSSIGPSGTDCWEVEIAFFNPDSVVAARVVVSQTIDVSDVIPYRIEDPKVYRKR